MPALGTDGLHAPAALHVLLLHSSCGHRTRKKEAQRQQTKEREVLEGKRSVLEEMQIGIRELNTAGEERKV